MEKDCNKKIIIKKIVTIQKYCDQKLYSNNMNLVVM